MKEKYITDDEREKCRKVADAFAELYEIENILVVDAGRYGFVKLQYYRPPQGFEDAITFTGKEPEEALDIIAKMCSIAIVKVGARGSLIRKGTEMVQVQAAPVEKVVDTTGAGDYFAAGFLYGLTCGYSLEKCGKIGSLLSKDVIQVVGTELQAAQWEKIKEEILLIN